MERTALINQLVAEGLQLYNLAGDPINISQDFDRDLLLVARKPANDPNGKLVILAHLYFVNTVIIFEIFTGDGATKLEQVAIHLRLNPGLNVAIMHLEDRQPLLGTWQPKTYPVVLT